MARVNIIDDFIKINTMSRPGTKGKKQWIVIHETGNYAKGAGAKNHSEFIKRLANENKNYLSWHYTVDDKEIYHHVPDDEVTWNAGDGVGDNTGNVAGISIEICVNIDSNFDTAKLNAARLIADIMLKYGLPLTSIKQHFDFNGKDCPRTIRFTGLWNEFVQSCKQAYDELTTQDNNNPPPNPPTQTIFKVGDKVKIKQTASVYATGEAIPEYIKNRAVNTIMQIGAEKILLKEIYSWVYTKDLDLVTSIPQPPQQVPLVMKVGSRVKYKGNLYSTSLGYFKGKYVEGIFTVSRIIEGRKTGVLLNGNLGWVPKSTCILL